VTHYQQALVDGSRIFYREAGSKDRPTILLLHGFPTSTHMFRNLIPELADRVHLVAPDLPGSEPGIAKAICNSPSPSCGEGMPSEPPFLNSNKT
jgi:pimeloyl-ACP methyl ester carboxylesterase